MFFEKTIQEEHERALSVPLLPIEVGRQKVILFRADTLPAGIKTSIGKCLLAHYLDSGQIKSTTKRIVVVGGGNTVQGVKLAVDELGVGIDVVAVIYAETSQPVIEKLETMGIEVVMETPRRKGRTGRQSTVEKLCRKNGYMLLEQHEQPLIIEIQRQTFGRAITEQLETPTNHFVAGVGTGGTLFGIMAALRNTNPRLKITAVEGVGSTLSLWHAYLRAKGKGYREKGMLPKKWQLRKRCVPTKKPE